MCKSWVNESVPEGHAESSLYSHRERQQCLGFAGWILDAIRDHMTE